MLGKLFQVRSAFVIVIVLCLLVSTGVQAASLSQTSATENSDNILGGGGQPQRGNLVLWNKLGSKEEVANSVVGMNGAFYGGSFDTGVFGDAFVATHNENRMVTFPREVIPVEVGAIELWAKLIDVPSNIPTGESPNLFRFQDSHGNNFAILFSQNDGEGNGGLTARAGHYFTAGTGEYSDSWTYQQALRGADVTQWHHYALVWDKNGISGVADGLQKVAIFVDGKLNSDRWHVGAPGEFVDLVDGELGLVDQNGHFNQGSVALDNIKIWNYAKTDFSDRFVENLATVILTKNALPDSPRNFHYYGPWRDFYLDDPGEDDGDAIKNSMRYGEAMSLGTYTFSEQKIANWYLDNISCSSSINAPASPTVNSLYRSVTIVPMPGERVVCSFSTKYASSLSVYTYWDMDQDGQRDPTEDFQDGWWTEFYDSSGKLKASNSTQNGGHWDLYNIRPGIYTVCQKPQIGWSNTQPILTDPAHHNWPCYTFELTYAQQAKLYFGYSNEPFVASANAQSAAEGVEIFQVTDPEQDALSTWEEFLAVHPGDRLPDEDEIQVEGKTEIYLPMVAR